VPDLLLPLADFFPHSPGPYAALMMVGFAIGILGHLFKVKWLVLSGVILIFLGALLFPLAAANLTHQSGPPPIEEIRGDSGP
jgi:hypothetical protein